MTSVKAALSTPLSSSSRVDELTDRLITAIAVGEYLPGSKLPPERDLAASLKVGRMTVRAAISRLVDRGLLVTQRGRQGGSFVTETWSASSNDAVQRTLTAKWDSLRDTCDAVSRLQGTISRAAAENRTDDDVATLKDRLADFRNAQSGLESQRSDSLLHLAIASAAHSETLQGVLFDLEATVSIAAPAHLWGSPDGMQEMEARALADHEQLVDAITEGRADDASRIAREHAKIDFELLEAALRTSGTAPST
jgi:GntR family transcriptional repressor for pyruvate dehydrogenase complex